MEHYHTNTTNGNYKGVSETANTWTSAGIAIAVIGITAYTFVNTGLMEPWIPREAVSPVKSLISKLD